MTAPGTAVVIGEALVDVVVHGGERFDKPGGSPLNVAVTLARLGVPTQLVSALGDDPCADLVEDHLAGSGVDLVAGARRLTATSSAVARLGEDGAATYAFDVRWDPPVPTVRHAAAVHAGSVALFLRPGRDVVATALRSAAGRALVTLDPNIRPSLLPDARMVRVAFEDLVPCADLVKLSDEDAQWLYPGRAPEEVLARMVDLGAATAAVSLGADGALLAGRHGGVAVAAPVVPVADTIGAGDAFMGGLVARLLDTGLAAGLVAGGSLAPDELTDIGRHAAQVAAMTVARRGADPPYREDVDAALGCG